MPYSKAFRHCLSLAKEQGFSWLITAIVTLTFAFFICPEDQSLTQITQEVSQKRSDVLQLVKRTEHLQTMLQLVEDKDPFTMERLIRDEFKLKRIKSLSND